jgi:membrane-bound metal-dependent hydrolase YbcI (DUF457 family)
MLGSTHLLFGVAALAVTEVALRTGGVDSLLLPPGSDPVSVEPALCLAAALLGSLAPDLDAEDSTIHHELGPLGWPVKAGLKLLGVRHRGVLHSGLATLVVTLTAGLIGRQVGLSSVGLAFALGYLSHVAIADALTLSGVPLWWPAKRRFHLLPRPLRVRTGGPVEKLVALGMVMLLVWLLPQAAPPMWVEMLARWAGRSAT